MTGPGAQAPESTGATTAGGDPVREKILQGAIRSIARHGVERSSIASVAREARVSRQTVYAHFGSRDEVLGEAVTRSATELTQAAVERALEAADAAGFLVELTLNVFHGVREHAAVSAMLFAIDTPEGRAMTMSAPVLDVVVRALAPLVDYEPRLAPRLEVVAETCLRFQVSLLTFPSGRTGDPERLRRYVEDVLPRLVAVD